MIDKPVKPAKPYPDFPLYAHATGYWCATVDKKKRYFGPWADWKGALAAYKVVVGATAAPPTAAAGAIKKTRTVPQVPPDFPLQPHATGRWCKRIKGKLYYFGKIEDPDAALAKYLDQRHDLQNGRRPSPSNGGGLTLKALTDAFLATKRLLHKQRRLDKQTLQGYVDVCKRLTKFFGAQREVSSLAPPDFESLVESLPQTWSLVTLGNFIRRSRVVFNYASDDDVGLIERPVRFGKVFSVPKRRDLKIETQGKPKKFFNAEEIQLLIGAAPHTMRAMILLGINCGFGNRDVAELITDVYQTDSKCLDYSRSKTGIARRCPLWPETRQAINDSLANRRQPLPGHERYVFLSRYGRGWYANGPSAISTAFRKLAKKCGLNCHGRGFYSLRHVFQTIGEESREKVAVSHIMGHSPSDMADVYREFISDDRLKRVTDHIHQWLYGKPSKLSKAS